MADPFILVIGDDLIFTFCVEDVGRDVVTTTIDRFTPWDSDVVDNSAAMAVPACATDECCWFTTTTVIGPVGTWRTEFSVLDEQGNSDMIVIYSNIS